MDEITSYEAADERLYNRFGVAVESRKLRNNTYLQRRTSSPNGLGGIAVRFHKTDVVTFHPGGQITLNSGGWYTKSTKDRMNAYLPYPFEVYSETAKGWGKSSTWRVSLSWEQIVRESRWGPYSITKANESIPFFDGICLDNYWPGRVHNRELAPEVSPAKIARGN